MPAYHIPIDFTNIIISREEYKRISEFDVCLSVHRYIFVKNKNQLDATECFIALIICSTRIGHFNAHHQDLETIYVCVITTYGLQCLVAGCRESSAGNRLSPRRGMLHDCCWLSGVRCRQQAVRPERGMLHDCVVQHPSFWTHSLLPYTWPPTTSNQALHTIGGNNTHIVSSSWWWE